MKPQLITKEVIEGLEYGDYAIFENNRLIDLISVDLFYNKVQIYKIGCDHSLSADDWDRDRFKNCYIVLASEVKLNV